MPGFIAEKAFLFFIPFDQALGTNKDSYNSSSSNICCYEIPIFFDNFFEMFIFVSLFYLLSQQRQINCVDLAFQLVLLKHSLLLNLALHSWAGLDLSGRREKNILS